MILLAGISGFLAGFFLADLLFMKAVVPFMYRCLNHQIHITAKIFRLMLENHRLKKKIKDLPNPILSTHYSIPKK